jgi:hypothetical protein
MNSRKRKIAVRPEKQGERDLEFRNFTQIWAELPTDRGGETDLNRPWIQVDSKRTYHTIQVKFPGSYHIDWG